MKLFSKTILSLQSAALAIGLVGGATAYAQDSSKIGFVNTDRIFKEAAPAKAASAKIERRHPRADGIERLFAKKM